MRVAVLIAAVLSVAISQQPPNQDDYVQSTGRRCGMDGDVPNTRAGKHLRILNEHKNRYTAPTPAQMDDTVHLSGMLAPGDDLDRFDAEKGAKIVGFVNDVKVGGNESCNCHAEQAIDCDTHIELCLSTEAPPSQRVIVEVTPRVRKQMQDQGVDWSTEVLQDADRGIRGQWVEVTGWLLFDTPSIHEAENTNPGGNRNWRATCWEIHPVTEIRVLNATPTEAQDFHPETLVKLQRAHAQAMERQPARRQELEKRNRALLAKFRGEDHRDGPRPTHRDTKQRRH
jgi:hypothetical protein